MRGSGKREEQLAVKALCSCVRWTSNPRYQSLKRKSDANKGANAVKVMGLRLTIHIKYMYLYGHASAYSCQNSSQSRRSV